MYSLTESLKAVLTPLWSCICIN